MEENTLSVDYTDYFFEVPIGALWINATSIGFIEDVRRETNGVIRFISIRWLWIKGVHSMIGKVAQVRMNFEHTYRFYRAKDGNYYNKELDVQERE